MFWKKATYPDVADRIAIGRLEQISLSAADRTRELILRPLVGADKFFHTIQGRRNLLGKPFSSKIHVTANSSRNANVCLIGNTHYINIYTGILNSAFYLVNRILSCREIFPEIGDFSLAGYVHKLPDVYNEMQVVSELDWGLDSTMEYLSALRPSCSVRSKLADDIYRIIIEFVALHELAHGALGHLYFIGESYSFNMIGDGDEYTNTGAADWSLAQVFEFECDIDALFTICDDFIRSSEFNDLESRKLGARQIIVGVTLAIWIISSREELMGVDENPNDSHPAALVRSLLLLLYFVQIGGANSFFQLGDQVVSDDIIALVSSSFAFSQYIPLWIALGGGDGELIGKLLDHVNIAIDSNRKDLAGLGRYRVVRTKLLGNYDGL